MKKLGLIVITLVLSAGLIASCAAPAPAPAPAPKVVPAPSPSPVAAPSPAPAASPVAKPAPATPQKTWKLKFHHEQTLQGAYHVWGHVPWKEDVERVTNGRVKIEIYPMQTLMKSKDPWEGVKSGVADIAWIFTGYYSGVFDLADSVTLPFMFPTGKIGSQVAWALYQKYPEIQKQQADNKILTVWTSEPYFILTTKKQVKTMADLKGMKIRATGGPPTDMIKLLGAVPMMIPMPDNYLNMQKGVTDGMMAPAEPVTDYKLYEVAKYYTWVPTPAVYFMLAMNKEIWNEMPRDIQDAIMSVSGEKQAIRYGGGVFDRCRTELPSAVKKAGAEFNEYTVPQDELNKWIDIAGKPVWDEWVKKMQAKGLPGKAILDDTLKLVKEFSAKP